MVKTAAIVGGASLGAVWLGTSVLETYGLALFLGLPCVIGFAAARLLSARSPRTLGDCVLCALLALAVNAAGLLAVGWEGAVCIVMALPLAGPLAALGAWAAYLGQRDDVSPRSVVALAVVLPLSMGVEAGADRAPTARAVTTTVVVDAPPAVVWRHVVSFPPLPAPRSLAFRAGIAYPTSASMPAPRIRRSHFSTGDFVERVTAWDPPRRLAVEVVSQPEPMRELSPRGRIHPPHLDGFLRTRRAEFRLFPLPGGRTRVVASTWYENRMWPARYWQVWSDELIHAIHRRVLENVARRAEDAR